jgi:hypothetical protein
LLNTVYFSYSTAIFPRHYPDYKTAIQKTAALLKNSTAAFLSKKYGSIVLQRAKIFLHLRDDISYR